MPAEVYENVYDITVATVSTPYGNRRFRAFVVDSDPVTLIDTGLPGESDALFDGLADLELVPERVIVTHGDPDHIGGFDAVVDEFGPTTWVPVETEVTSDSAPTHRYSDGDTIGEFTAVKVAGHEPDNYVLVNEAMGVAVMGDALSGADQRGLPEGYLILPPADKSRDLHEAEQNLEKLLDYEFEAALVFHGTSVTENASEKIARFVNYPGKH